MKPHHAHHEFVPTLAETLAAATHVALLGNALDRAPESLRAQLDRLAECFIASRVVPVRAARRRKRHG